MGRPAAGYLVGACELWVRTRTICWQESKRIRLTTLSGQGGKAFSERSCKLKFRLHLLRAVRKRPATSRQVVNFSLPRAWLAPPVIQSTGGSYCSQIELVHYQHLSALHPSSSAGRALVATATAAAVAATAAADQVSRVKPSRAVWRVLV